MRRASALTGQIAAFERVAALGEIEDSVCIADGLQFRGVGCGERYSWHEKWTRSSGGGGPPVGGRSGPRPAPRSAGFGCFGSAKQGWFSEGGSLRRKTVRAFAQSGSKNGWATTGFVRNCKAPCFGAARWHFLSWVRGTPCPSCILFSGGWMLTSHSKPRHLEVNRPAGSLFGGRLQRSQGGRVGAEGLRDSLASISRGRRSGALRNERCGTAHTLGSLGAVERSTFRLRRLGGGQKDRNEGSTGEGAFARRFCRCAPGALCRLMGSKGSQHLIHVHTLGAWQIRAAEAMCVVKSGFFAEVVS